MRYMSLFAQIGEHQICETGILIAFKDLSRQDVGYTKRFLGKRRKFKIEPIACTLYILLEHLSEIVRHVNNKNRFTPPYMGVNKRKNDVSLR